MQVDKTVEEASMQNEKTEPWEAWETKLVWYSIGIGIICLILGGILINTFVL